MFNTLDGKKETFSTVDHTMSLRVGMSMCICVGCWMRVLASSAAVKIGVSSQTVYTAQLHRWKLPWQQAELVRVGLTVYFLRRVLLNACDPRAVMI